MKTKTPKTKKATTKKADTALPVPTPRELVDWYMELEDLVYELDEAEGTADDAGCEEVADMIWQAKNRLDTL